MLAPEEMREILKDRNLVKVSELSGINYNTLRRFVNREADTKGSILEQLSEYLERQ